MTNHVDLLWPETRAPLSLLEETRTGVSADVDCEIDNDALLHLFLIYDHFHSQSCLCLTLQDKVICSVKRANEANEGGYKYHVGVTLWKLIFPFLVPH